MPVVLVDGGGTGSVVLASSTGVHRAPPPRNGARLAALTPTPVGAEEPDPDTIIWSDGTTSTIDPRLSALSAGGAETPGWVPKGLKVAPKVEPDAKGVPRRAPLARSVISPDERIQVSNTSIYPYSAIVRITFVGITENCSGFLVDRDTVITAGHCVYSGNQWLDIAQVVPGQNGTLKPFGQCQELRTASVWRWIQYTDRNYDFGMIKLNCTVGFDTGWIGYRYTPGSLDGDWNTVGGYPHDKPTATQWRDADEVRRTADYRLFYANDTFTGQSGSPAWAIANDGTTRIAIAIHAYGVVADPNGDFNSGTRVTQYVYDVITSWKQQQ